jgi:hypothetical protein
VSVLYTCIQVYATQARICQLQVGALPTQRKAAYVQVDHGIYNTKNQLTRNLVLARTINASVRETTAYMDHIL